MCTADPDREGPLTLFYDAGKPVNRCLGGEGTRLPYLSSKKGLNCTTGRGIKVNL